MDAPDRATCQDDTESISIITVTDHCSERSKWPKCAFVELSTKELPKTVE